MKTILETERLLLREFQVKDAQKMYELNTDPEVIKYTGDTSFESIQQAKIFLKIIPIIKGMDTGAGQSYLKDLVSS